jgi:hypothetical protein
MTIERSDRIVALLGKLTREDYGALPPVERRRLIESLEEVHRIAKTEEAVAEAKEATTGVLADPKAGKRSQ